MKNLSYDMQKAKRSATVSPVTDPLQAMRPEPEQLLVAQQVYAVALSMSIPQLNFSGISSRRASRSARYVCVPSSWSCSCSALQHSERRSRSLITSIRNSSISSIVVHLFEMGSLIPILRSCFVTLVRDTPTLSAMRLNDAPFSRMYAALSMSHVRRLCSMECVLWSTTSKFSGLLSALSPLMWWTDSFGTNGRPSFMLAISRCSFNFLPPNEAVL